MTIQECYEILEGDYPDTLRRLGKEDRVRRFLSLLPRDDSFHSLRDALAEGNYVDAFRAAHTLKGIALNLGLTRLTDFSSRLTECLRGGVPEDHNIGGLFEELTAEYEKTVWAVNNIDG